MVEKKAKTEKSPKEDAKEVKVVKAPKESAKKSVETVEPDTDKVAKAGKRSTKAITETKEKLEKEARKVAKDPEATPVKAKIVKPTRSRLERRSKKYREGAALIDKTKQYSLSNAIGLVGKTSLVKFDAAVEIHIRLNVDPRHADQNIRDTIVLPSGNGKTSKIVVFADANDAAAALKAGADIAGIEEVTKMLDKNQLDFDVLIAHPSLMAQLGKYARILGPRGLMPNPKSGTVAADIVKAVAEAKAGKIEYRVDSSGIIHVGIGKVSFGAEKLLKNADVLMTNIRANKPSSVKGSFIKSIFLSTTMGPSLSVDIAATD